MSKAKQHEDPLEDPVTRKLVKKLTADWNDLDFVERGVRLKALNKRGCNDHELGRALKVDHKTGVDHKTISRYRRIAELPEEQRAQIAQGASAAPFLKAQKNLQGRAEAAPRHQQKATVPSSSGTGKLIQESRPEPRLSATQSPIAPLINTVQQLEKRISTIEASQESILRGLNQDAASKALSREPEKAPIQKEAAGEVKRFSGQWPPDMIERYEKFEKDREIKITRRQYW